MNTIVISAGMLRPFCLLLIYAASLLAADDPVFRSEVSMSRVDARVVDRNGRTVTGLTARDFVLRLDGKELPVRNFANENTPIDILLLLDVSGSMEPHVERIASAAQQALNVLAERDRVAIMVFDTRTRVRLPFRSAHDEIAGELKRLLRAERFNGGTRITGSLLEAARYVEREARPDARRAIVILTDDMTQDEADEGRVEAALHQAGAILSFLQAPYEEDHSFGRGGGTGGRPRGTWGSGGGWPGGGWPGGGQSPGRFPGGGGMPGGGERSHSAGTETIATDSGGDTMQVQDAAALEDTLSRLRQRYALYFYVPEGANAGGRQNVQVALAEAASLRYHDASIESRRIFMAGGNRGTAGEPVTVTHVPSMPPEPASTGAPSSSSSAKRGRAVNEDSGPKVNSVDPAPTDPDQKPASASPSSSPEDSQPKHGWPRVNPQAPSSPPNLLFRPPTP